MALKTLYFTFSPLSSDSTFVFIGYHQECCVQRHLILPVQVLDKARKRLSDVTQERTRVLDLICHAIPSISASAGPITRRVGNLSTSYARPTSVNGMSPVQDVDPLGAYTPEVDAALKDAKEARERHVL